jgi:hypothetical protein
MSVYGSKTHIKENSASPSILTGQVSRVKNIHIVLKQTPPPEYSHLTKLKFCTIKQLLIPLLPPQQFLLYCCLYEVDCFRSLTYVESHSISLLVAYFTYHSVLKIPSSMCSRCQNFFPFSMLNNILCVYHILCIHSPVNRHLVCFHLVPYK